MLNQCQNYANNHSFEFTMSKSNIVVFGPDEDYNYEWVLGDQKMVQLDHYRYLGLVFRRCLGSFGKQIQDISFKRKFLKMKLLDPNPAANQLRMNDSETPTPPHKCCKCKKPTINKGKIAQPDVILCDFCNEETHLQCTNLERLPPRQVLFQVS